jgi:hypothetical protein
MIIFMCCSGYLKNIALARVVEEVKKGSSRWMKQRTGNSLFYWQTGYSAFSVSRSKVNTMTRCIARQKAHHMNLSYRQEIERFMKEYDIWSIIRIIFGIRDCLWQAFPQGIPSGAAC